MVKEGISNREVLAGETFKARVGFGAEIDIIAEAEVEVDKFSTASRGADSNIEGLDINNSAAGLIALVFALKRPKYILIVANFFLYLSISF